MVSESELARIIPAHLIRSGPHFLIECAYQSSIHVDVKFTEGDAAFVDQTKGLSCERKGYRGAILRCFLVGAARGFCRRYRLPARGKNEGTIFIINRFRRSRC